MIHPAFVFQVPLLGVITNHPTSTRVPRSQRWRLFQIKVKAISRPVADQDEILGINRIDRLLLET